MSVAQRIELLNSIFTDFGIPVVPNSTLDFAIRNEFGPGKRSRINKVLLEYNQHTDAAYLSLCIGAELKREFCEPELIALGNVMCERLPSVIAIADVRQQSIRREQDLEQIIRHFQEKIPKNKESERLLRMLNAAEKQIHINMQLQTIGTIVEHSGIITACHDLKKCGTILKAVTPALVSLGYMENNPSQTVNQVIHAMRTLANELQISGLNKAAKIIEYVHWFAQVNMPAVRDVSSVENILSSLDIPFATLTARQLRDKTREVGLYDEELRQILYLNQRYAATCGILAKFAQDIDCPQLEKIAVSGLCLLSLRQTYAELKTNNCHAENFSESMGILFSGLGTLTDNNFLSKLGRAITNGVKTYTGLLAVPGGASIAIPLAICSVMGSVFIRNKPRAQVTKTNTPVAQAICEMYKIQRVMQWHFLELQTNLNRQHNELASMLQNGFANLLDMARHWQVILHKSWRRFEDIQHTIHREFSDLYLEYIRDPIEKLKFYEDYTQYDEIELPKIKLKLNMWLLYKSKSPKANGRTLPETVLQDCIAPDATLGLLNSYVNRELGCDFNEELPHIPTWILAAEAYIVVFARYRDREENRILQDIISVGEEVLSYIQSVRSDERFWLLLAENLNGYMLQARALLDTLKPQAEVLARIDIAQPAPLEQQLEQQLEQFNASAWQIKWEDFAIDDIFSLAVHYKIGEFSATYTVLPSNKFVDVRSSVGPHPLPDDAGQVRFKVEVSFKINSSSEIFLLARAIYSYQLPSLDARFEQYYKNKFKHSLKHRSYDWISVDGRQNQITGHPVTSTQKLIDFFALANMYQNWFCNSVLESNHKFAHPVLLRDLSEKIEMCRASKERGYTQAKMDHPMVPILRQKIATYKVVQQAFKQITDSDMEQNVEHVVARLRLLLPTCSDIMPSLEFV